MRKRAWILAICFFALPALAAAQNIDASPNKSGMGMMMHGTCPATLKTAEIAVADVPNGIAVTFTAKPGAVAELQGAVEWLANMQKAMENAPAMRERVLAGDVKYEPLPDGARLVLTAKDPANLDEFRTQARARVDLMSKGNCSMMENMMRAMTRK